MVCTDTSTSKTRVTPNCFGQATYNSVPWTNIKVTIGEVEDARSDACVTDLFVVSEIVLQQRADKSYVGQGGVVHIEHGWAPGDDVLRPIRFKYRPEG